MKSINVYDREKRHQIMNDVGVLLGALVDEERHGYKYIHTNLRCNFIVSLFGAYYEQGRVKVIL